MYNKIYFIISASMSTTEEQRLSESRKTSLR